MSNDEYDSSMQNLVESTRPPQTPKPTMDYDPNICRNFATHTVKLTFGQWTYRAERTVKVGGNCSGLGVIETAVGSVYDKLPDNGDGPEIILTNMLQEASGKNATMTVAEEGDEDFLQNILIGAEIIALEPDQEVG